MSGESPSSPKPVTTNFFIAALPLLLAIFFDGMGLGIAFPALNGAIVEPAHSILPHTVTLYWRSIIYGASVSVFMLGWFFGAAILGDLSDSIGRKKALLICLFGSAIGYVWSAFSIEIGSIVMLLTSRLFAGFLAGSQPIAQAAVVDLSTDETRSRNLGYILLAASFGFIFGPMFGAVFTNSNLVSWFNMSTPFYFAAILAGFNGLLLFILFKETDTHIHKTKINWFYPVLLFVSAFRDREVRMLSVIFLFLMIGWSGYFSFLPVFLYDRYHFSASEVGVAITVLAVGFGIGTGILVNQVSKRFALPRAVSVFSLITAVAILFIALTHNRDYTWVVILFAGATMAVAYTLTLSIFSSHVSESKQGWIMGVSSSVLAFGFATTSFGLGFTMKYGSNIPLVFAAMAILISGALMFATHRNRR